MNIKTVSSTLELPNFYLLFTGDVDPDTIARRVWWKVEEVFRFVAPSTPDYNFYAVALPEVNNDDKQMAERLGGISRARSIRQGRSKRS